LFFHNLEMSTPLFSGRTIGSVNESSIDPERKYKLLAERWTDTYGVTDYGGKTFYAVEGSHAAYLEVDVESLDAVKKQRKVLPGMALPSN
jgi:hypothetical protein